MSSGFFPINLGASIFSITLAIGSAVLPGLLLSGIPHQASPIPNSPLSDVILTIT